VAPRSRLDPKHILSTLVERDVQFVVIGAIAAIAQGGPLITEDLDITLHASPTTSGALPLLSRSSTPT
jgi:hypothetical protein